ncbi:MAG: hypothetical protein KF873_10725 [Gemmataceae bacterium]|nr:hypothetical protein [Gemmataceae bacterium]
MPLFNAQPVGSAITALAERPQVDFEVEFFDRVLAQVPDYVEVLRAQASNLTLKGRIREGLKVDQRLVATRPRDATAHYNLACRYAVLRQRELALMTLRRAVELGYRDFRYMVRDSDLASIQKDPKFLELLRDYGGIAS